MNSHIVSRVLHNRFQTATEWVLAFIRKLIGSRQAAIANTRIIQAGNDGSKIVGYKSDEEQKNEQEIQSKVEKTTTTANRLNTGTRNGGSQTFHGNDGSKIVGYKSDEEQKNEQEIQSKVEKTTTTANRLNTGTQNDESQTFHINEENISLFVDSDISLDTGFTPETINSSRKQIVINALKIVCARLSCQSAAIFLFSKHGRLERAGIYGTDNEGRVLLDDWFEDESYAVDGDYKDISFTGKAAKPSSRDYPYGEIQFAHCLQDEKDLKKESFDRYKEKFGELRCAIAIPLNGKNRTYGVLRIINKLNNKQFSKSIISKKPFSQVDVEVLLVLGASVSNALSNFRRELESKIFKYLSRSLILQTASVSIEDLQKTVFKDVVDLLVCNPETPFQVAILRIREKSGNKDIFTVRAISSLPKDLLDGRNNEPIETEEGSSGLIWRVVKKGEPLIVPDLQESELLSQFRNSKWIQEKQFTEFACFPLLTDKGEVCGSLSVYIGFRYRFYPDIVEFLQGIVDLFTLSVMKIRQEQQSQIIKELQDQLLNKNPTGLSNSKSIDQVNSKSIDQEFYDLAIAWKQETKSLPILRDKFQNRYYRQIIALGNQAVPLLIKELQEKPDHWFYALESILGISPVKDEDRGDISCMVESWIEWWEQKGYVSVE
jgi:GAF domain-containing protein